MIPRSALLLFTLLSLLPLRTHAADLQIRAAEVVGYGICEVGWSRREFGFTRLAPPGDIVKGVHFVEFTHEIPAEIGVSFGIEYVINSQPRGTPLDVTTVIRFPEEGMQQPGGRLYKESREHHKVKLGEKEFYGYRFDHEWEIVPGQWVIEVWHRDARLIRKRFSVMASD